MRIARTVNAAGTDQINRAIQELNRVVQRNAAAAEEMSSTASALAMGADELSGTVAFFRLDGAAAPGALPDAAPRRRLRAATG